MPFFASFERRFFSKTKTIILNINSFHSREEMYTLVLSDNAVFNNKLKKIYALLISKGAHTVYFLMVFYSFDF